MKYLRIAAPTTATDNDDFVGSSLDLLPRSLTKLNITTTETNSNVTARSVRAALRERKASVKDLKHLVLPKSTTFDVAPHSIKAFHLETACLAVST